MVATVIVMTINNKNKINNNNSSNDNNHEKV